MPGSPRQCSTAWTDWCWPAAETSKPPPTANNPTPKPSGPTGCATTGSSHCWPKRCRGVHVLNVALGGTLHQHLPDVLGHSGHRSELGVYSVSTERVVPGSRLAALVSDGAQVKCHHHQAVDRLAEPLVVTATAADGVVEAVELPGPAFVVAVQWHPEETPDSRRLFEGLVEAARTFVMAGR